MKKPALIVILIVLAGCSGSVKSFWNNFRAHYNTHYNAQKSFRAGLKQIEEQSVVINPAIPVRVHRAPGDAGSPDFKNTIDKETRLLRKFPDTRWADDALFLVGKSYYYQNELYLALQKFEELYALDTSSLLKQKAVIWKGRTMLDLAQHQEAILYLENQLAMLEDVWTPSLKAETEILLAEHYVQVEDWESSAGYLGRSIFKIEDKSFRGRAFFLYGQVLERLERYGEAIFAYSRVAPNFPDYEYIYWAGIMKGRVARLKGDHDLALSVFTSMKRDDKNFRRRDELDFEIARTQEVKGNIDVAEQIYNRMLHLDANPVSRHMQSKIYYRLGMIYSEGYQNYQAAAAYFDSSSTQASNPDIAGAERDAGLLASTFGTYASLRQEIGKIDRLLWLGSLSPSELDSALAVIRVKNTRALQRERKDRGSSENILANVDYTRTEEERSPLYGFLNHKNQRLVDVSKRTFRVIWGNRPLADNWRRMEAGRKFSSTGKKSDVVSVPDADGNANVPDTLDSPLDIDIAEIPSTEAERQKLSRERAQVLYRLGNLFFLTLDLPDSAAAYFRNVAREQSQSRLEARSMYALFELYSLQEKKDSSAYWAARVLQMYPNTGYARRISRQLDDGAVTYTDSLSRRPAQAVNHGRSSRRRTGEDPADALLVKVQAIEDSSAPVSLAVRAEKFRRLALANRSSGLAPHIYYRAIEDYVRLAKNQTDAELYTQFWEDRKPGEAPEDSSLSRQVQRKDSAGMRQHMPENPFSGAYWDSVRTVINEYDTTFTGAPHSRQINVLQKILAGQK